MLTSLKYIVENKNKIITIPKIGEKDCLSLHSNNYDFLFDLNRGGHKKSKCTFQLRHGSRPLLRFDLIGKAHFNPVGDYTYSGQTVECPHVHLADFKGYGIKVALPLNDPIVRIKLNEYGTNDLIFCLKETLIRVNVANRDDFNYNEATELIK